MNRNFALLWQGQAVSQIGTQISTIAMLFWLKHATESPVLMGAMQMFAGLVSVLFGPIGGAFADRYRRRSIIIICDLISGLAVLSLSALMFLAPSATVATLAWVFVISIALSVINSFFLPAISASIPDLAPREKVAGANSMLQASIQISSLVGQGVGGALFRLLGAPLVFLIDGVTYLFSAFSELFISIPQTPPEKKGDWRAQTREFKREIWEGVDYVRKHAGLTQLLVATTLLNFFLAPILGLFTFYVEDHLKLHPDWFGYLLTIYGVGSLIGYLLAGAIPLSGRRRAGWMIAFMTLESVLYGLLGVAMTPLVVAAIALVGGAASGFVMVNVSTILQLTTPSEIRGRVFGLLATISACIAPLGMGLAGAVAWLLEKNIPLIYLACGVCMVLVTLVASSLSSFRRYLAFDAAEGGEPASAPGQLSDEATDRLEAENSHDQAEEINAAACGEIGGALN
jgi:MFS family permease